MCGCFPGGLFNASASDELIVRGFVGVILLTQRGKHTKKTVKMFCNESVLDPAVEEKEPCLITS